MNEGEERMVKPRGVEHCIRAVWIALGVAVFLVSGRAGDWPLGFERLALSQLWKFQAILKVVGLGLVIVCLAADLVDRLVKTALDSVDDWLLQDGRRCNVLLILLIAIYAITYGGVTFYRHYSFNSTGYDLAILDQVVWNTAHGRFFARSVFGIQSQLGAHIRPYTAFLSLPYTVLPSPYVLLAFQSLVLALTALPIYRLTRRKFDSPGAGLVIVFCGLAYTPLGFLNRFDFHPEVVAVPLLSAAYERLDAADLKGTLVLAGVALFAKEDIGVTVAALGLMIAFRHRRWLLGLLSSLVSVAYSATALLVIIPFFRGQPSHALSRYGWLGETAFDMVLTVLSRPRFVLANIVEANRITTLLQLLAPQAFMPVMSWSSLILAAPSLLYHYLSRHFCQPTIYCQYMVPVIPSVLISSVLGMHWLTSSERGKESLRWITAQQSQAKQGLGLGIGLIFVATLASWTYQNPITDDSFASPVFSVQPNDSSVREGLRHVPDDVALATTNAYAPHLSQRRELEILMYGRTPDHRTEALFLNLKDLRWTTSCADYRAYLELADGLDFGVVFYRDGVIVAQKHAGSRDRLRELLHNWPGCE